MADVFVSYKRDDKDAVAPLVRRLREDGLTVWWDWEIAPTAPWEATIEIELGAAKKVIVAWSKASVHSENVKAEARRAKAQSKLIQIFVEECEPPLFFGERQGIDLCNWNGSVADPGYAALLATLRDQKSHAHDTRAQARKSRLPVIISAGLAAVSTVVLVAFNVEQTGFAGSRPREELELEGTWGRPGCPSPQLFEVANDVITVRASDWVSTGRVLAIRDGAIFSETQTPVSERGRLMEFRVQGDQLIVRDRTTDVQQVLDRCE